MRLKLMITGFTPGIFALPVWAENGLEIIGQPVADLLSAGCNQIST